MSRIMLTIVAKGRAGNDMRSDEDSNRFFDSLSGQFVFVKLMN